jgi:hypothetical protein
VRPLILSYDGFGEDGAFIFFAGSKASALADGGFDALRAVRMETWSIGKAFVRVGMSPPSKIFSKSHHPTKRAMLQQSTPRRNKARHLAAKAPRGSKPRHIAIWRRHADR